MITIHNKPSLDFVNGVSDKDTIVIHATAGGSLVGAEATLAAKDRVNVHYIIDRDGSIYRYIDEKYWAYHTGVQSLCKRSIGIEMVCYLTVQKVDEKFYTLYHPPKEIPADEIIQLKSFRGLEYYQTLTQKQKTSLCWLLSDIKSRHQIGKNIYRMPGKIPIESLRGVITHAVVSTKRYDYPPDYPLGIG